MIVMLDHIGVVAHTIEEAMETARLRAQGFRQMDQGVADPNCRLGSLSSHPEGIRTTTCSPSWAKPATANPGLGGAGILPARPKEARHLQIPA